MKMRPKIHPEQVLVVGLDREKFVLSGDYKDSIPWGSLGTCYLYALDEPTLFRMLEDATKNDYMILDGSRNDRRGLRSFTVGIGAYGWRGKVECLTIEQWALEANEDTSIVEECGRIEADLRRTCTRLNAEKDGFKASSTRWVSSVKRRYAIDDDSKDPFPEHLSLLFRRAHVGGPIIHARTTLEPFVHIDRTRAYGNAMLEDLPCGKPAEVSVKGTGMHRWKPRDLMARTAILEATVEVFEGPLIPLLPLLKWHALTQRTLSLYATGTLRGVFCSHELVFLEQSGLGRVTHVHQAYDFESRPVFAPVIRYLRRVEADLPVHMKRLEHILYGQCSRKLLVHSFASGSNDQSPVLGDLVKTDMLRRLRAGTKVSPMSLMKDTPEKSRSSFHRLFEVRGALRGQASLGFSDRPDRAAWITSSNRIQIAKLIQTLDVALGAKRSGNYVGRVYVDSLDIQARPSDLPPLEGVTVRHFGPSMHIYRSGGFWAETSDGTPWVGSSGISLPSNASKKDVEASVARTLDAGDVGPFSNGRSWKNSNRDQDPRMLPGQQSEPLNVDLQLLENLGFTDPKEDEGTPLSEGIPS